MKRLLPFVALAVLANTAVAQRRGGGGGDVGDRPARFEIMAGANFAKLAGDGDDSDTRTGFVGGIGFIKPLAPGWAFQPEVAFSMKGGEGNDAGTSSTLKLDYIEVPILFRYEFASGRPAGGGVSPFINFGGAPEFNISCSVEASSGSASVNSDCGNGIKTFDFGLVGGAGLAFHSMGRELTVGVRYTHGLSDIADDFHAKNRVWSVVGTIDFPSRSGGRRR
ncbi:MAG TPA: porin family protein [Gemmatimonadaceae bacterium]|jgi:hypothetical protein